MMLAPPVVALDTTPLGLITQRAGASSDVTTCREWLADLLAAGHRIVVPAIAAYELRRELVRAQKLQSAGRLDEFLDADPSRFLPLTRGAVEIAADLWAEARNAGRPTAKDAALDGDVIVAAQVLSLRLPASGIVVATSNPKHLGRFVPADDWKNIQPVGS